MDKNELDDERDNNLINELISGVQTDENSLDFLSRELEPGEKANDAEDFEDIADDDLADDEDVTQGENAHIADGDSLEDVKPTLGSDRLEDDSAFDDLFGDQPSSPPTEQKDGIIGTETIAHAQQNGSPILPSIDPRPASAGISKSPTDNDPSEAFSDMEFELGDDEDPELKEQRELFAQAQKEREERLRKGDGLLEFLSAPQTNAELFETIWPQFQPNTAPRFHELLGVKRAFYIEKKPIKPPKAILPTKLNLDLMQDQERTFRLPGSDVMSRQQRLQKAKQDQVILVNEANIHDQSDASEVELDNLNDEALVGNISLQDLSLLCEDWNIQAADDTDTTDEDLKLDDVGKKRILRSPKVCDY